MQFLIENWFLIVVAVAVIIVAARAVYAFMKRPTDAQLNSVKEWLLWACTEAEKELGGGTGKLKLRYVYDAFLSKFPVLAKVITFDMLSDLVTDVLVSMREILATNNSANAYVYGTTTATTDTATTTTTTTTETED
jgi:hypothetical protein